MAYRKINVTEYIGKRYGRLIIVGRSLIGGKKGKGYTWDCVCDCGNKVQVLSNHLFGKQGAKTRSCGCLHDENSRKYRSAGESGALRAYKSYKSGAARRNLSFELSYEEFKELTSKDCYYCGTSPYRTSVVPESKTHYSSYKYNGLDALKKYLDFSKKILGCPIKVEKWVRKKGNKNRTLVTIKELNEKISKKE